MIILLIHDLGESKVCNLNVPTNISTREEDVTGLEIVVDNGRLDFVQILQGRNDLV